MSLDDLRERPRGENEARIRALCQNAYLGDGEALCRILGRYKIFVDTADVGLSTHLLLDGFWEMWVTEVMAALVRPGMVAVDVGANLGYFTLLLAELVGPSGQVHAFEPNPQLAGRLRKSVSINGFGAWTEVHEIALADQEGGEADLIVPAGEPKNGYLAPAGHAPPGSIRLHTRRLDSFPFASTAAFVKIDADTSEEAIWRGAHGLLNSERPMTVLLEFAPARYADPAAFLDEIAAHGFALNLIGLERGVRPATPSQILAGSPVVDRMLALCR